MVDFRGITVGWIHLLTSQTWLQFSKEQHHFFMYSLLTAFEGICLLFISLLNYALNVEMPSWGYLCQYMINMKIIY